MVSASYRTQSEFPNDNCANRVAFDSLSVIRSMSHFLCPSVCVCVYVRSFVYFYVSISRDARPEKHNAVNTKYARRTYAADNTRLGFYERLRAKGHFPLAFFLQVNTRCDKSFLWPCTYNVLMSSR